MSAPTRNIQAATPFGPARFTPKLHRHSSLIASYQATCLRQGHGICNKTFSVSKAVSPDMCRRLLKYWLLLDGGDTHKKEFDDIVVPAFTSGQVPSEADLDIMAVVPEEPATKKHRVGLSKASSSSSSLACAGASTVAPMTPPSVRARMTEKMDRGEIPKTTVEQRRRSRRTCNTEYFFIGDWGEAVKYNYVTPGLPNPYGWFWFPEPGNRWYLRPRLGG